MADKNREPERKRLDKRVLFWSAAVAAVVLVLFVFFNLGFRTAPDTTTGGPDAFYASPPTAEETQPATPQDN